MSTTRMAIMQQVADALGLRLSGTLTAGANAGTSSFTDTIRRHEQDGHAAEGFILANPGQTTQQERRISAFANGTQTGTIYGTWATELVYLDGIGQPYDIYLPPVTPEQYRSAIKAVRNKLAARGITRRYLDTTLSTTRGRLYEVPSALDFRLAEVWVQASELIPNRDWRDDESGWTLHANASLTNDGTGGARTLKLIATAAGEASYQDVQVAGGEEFEFYADILGGGTGIDARWRYQVLDAEGDTLVSATTIEDGSDDRLAWTEQKGAIALPVNAATLRLLFDASAAGTVYSQGPHLMRRGDWERLTGWHVEYDGDTMLLSLDGEPCQGRRLKLIGRRALESLSADSSTLSLDEPEIAVFVEMACEEVWRQFGTQLGQDQGRVDAEISKHKRAWMEIIGNLGGEWRVRRTVKTPQFGAGH